MRRVLGGFITLAAIAGLVVLSYLAVQAWLEVKNGSSSINGPTVGVSNYKLPTFTGELDNSGYDISFPQCRTSIPPRRVGYVIIGLNHGKPMTSNPCFAEQWKWAKQHDAAAIYINTSDPGISTATNRGTQIARDTLSRLSEARVSNDVPIWLDVETHNSWSDSDRAVTMIDTLLKELHRAGHPVGIYSTPVEWFTITLDANVSVPTWVAIGKYSSISDGVIGAKRTCNSSNFGGKQPSIVQFVGKSNGIWLDRNIMCTNPAGLVARP